MTTGSLTISSFAAHAVHLYQGPCRLEHRSPWMAYRKEVVSLIGSLPLIRVLQKGSKRAVSMERRTLLTISPRIICVALPKQSSPFFRILTCTYQNQKTMRNLCTIQ
ncbi:hypothetical protein M427DRAFT_461768 [Gonapodya prolifera JEL478]|uniref:Uncharacterized protein n=1 Tax=Gonapodya prolifera (strain JEL478) TaxID=1344416 RepID=A0A139A266_GONPJ|nr:hypothetical protein M427DRAFT_461768 [Gonapodya prolifera JEL478]|eukprot:KXS10789.1 hypothetical protein M427DRAFT_461768 [Gonapodya prolifera JEL478]